MMGQGMLALDVAPEAPPGSVLAGREHEAIAGRGKRFRKGQHEPVVAVADFPRTKIFAEPGGEDGGHEALIDQDVDEGSFGGRSSVPAPALQYPVVQLGIPLDDLVIHAYFRIPVWTEAPARPAPSRPRR